MKKMICFLMFSFFSFNVVVVNAMAASIDDKSDLKKAVERYEQISLIGEACVSSKMTDTESCNSFARYFNNGLNQEISRYTNNIASYVQIDLETALQGIEAVISVAESLHYVVEYNKKHPADS